MTITGLFIAFLFLGYVVWKQQHDIEMLQIEAEKMFLAVNQYHAKLQMYKSVVDNNKFVNKRQLEDIIHSLPLEEDDRYITIHDLKLALENVKNKR